MVHLGVTAWVAGGRKLDASSDNVKIGGKGVDSHSHSHNHNHNHNHNHKKMFRVNSLSAGWGWGAERITTETKLGTRYETLWSRVIHKFMDDSMGCWAQQQQAQQR